MPVEDAVDDRRLLMGTIVHQFVDDHDTGMKTHLSEIIRALVDTESMENSNVSQFLRITR